MIIIGELINASRKTIGTAIREKDAGVVRDTALQQAEHGAFYIDVNAGIFMDDEPEYLSWLVENVQAVTDVPCAIDSPNPKAIEAALALHGGATPMINSISLESDRWENMLPIVAGTDFKVVALCMSDEGMPQTVEDRMRISDKLVNGLVQNNVRTENIFIDPLVQPLGVNKEFGIQFLDSIDRITTQFAGIHTACGLSNISYGLPGRKHINRAFMTIAITRGLDGAILNPLDKGMLSAIALGEALAGKDDFCMKYLKAFRAGSFEATA